MGPVNAAGGLCAGPSLRLRTRPSAIRDCLQPWGGVDETQGMVRCMRDEQVIEISNGGTKN